MKKISIVASALLSCTLAANAQTPSAGKPKMPQTPEQVHQSAIVIDTHADTPQRFVDEHWSFTDPLNGGMLNFDSARAVYGCALYHNDVTNVQRMRLCQPGSLPQL